VNKKILIALFFLCSVCSNAQQDTLAKYSEKHLIKKCVEYKGFAYPVELLKRNTTDSIKGLAHASMAELYININNLDKAIVHEETALSYLHKDKYAPLKMEVLNVLASHYVLQGNFRKALMCINQIKKEKNSTSDISIIYFLMGDFKKSQDLNFLKLESSNKDIENTSSKDERDTQLFRQMITNYTIASTYSYEKKIDSSYFYIKEAEKIAEKINFEYFNNWWYKTTFNLIIEKKYDKALERMEESKKFIESSTAEIYQASYYKALCWQAKGDYKKSLEFSELGLKHVFITFSFLNFELELYNIASQSAHKLGLTEKEIYYTKKYNEGAKKINYQAKAAFLAKLYNTDVIAPLNLELVKKEQKNNYLWWGLATLAGLSGILFFYSQRRAKKEKKQFQIIIAKLEKKHNEKTNTEIAIETPEEIETEATITSENQAGKITISAETERKIVKKLENFERKMQFLSSDISLATVAQDFKTNINYIAYTVKKHKSNNFNGYVNKLRIDYITHKLKFHSEYANYKIEYLAQESGFASYSTFKRIFTKETGIDPSKFIAYLKQYNQEME